MGRIEQHKWRHCQKVFADLKISLDHRQNALAQYCCWSGNFVQSVPCLANAKKWCERKKNNNTDFNEFKESITFDWVRRSSCFGHRFLPLIKSALQFAMSSFEFNYKVVMEIRMEASKWRNGWEIIWQRNFNEH